MAISNQQKHLKMKKQTVLVTGASSGIGKAVAKYFLDKGDNVVINSVTADKLEEAYQELGAGDNLAYVAGDVSKKETGENLVKTAVEKFGSADVLVNSAGIFERKPFLEVDEAYLDRFMSINFKGTFFTSQAVIPQMIKQQGGVIINIGAPVVNHAFGGSPTTAAISSKGAIHALTKQLAAEFGKQNIRVNSVGPGFIRTPLQGDKVDNLASLPLLKRIGEPEEVAQMIYAIANSTYVTGALIDVDGGIGAGHYLN
jgi:NAD(P)-dependent dehydrogenase (short-subunit alcohol dehydrogenase family)